jgi:urea carboxylase-associated protein 2
LKDRPVLFEEIVQPGSTWSHVLKRGTVLKMTDIDGGANVGALFHNWENTAERYNMPDTLKAQHTAHLTTGHALYSDMGRVLCSIVADDVGWHDPIAGCGNAALVMSRYGSKPYQAFRNDRVQNAWDGFTIELAKYGMRARDMTAPVNFFSKVAVDPEGAMHFVEGHSDAGMSVELRADMNVLVTLNTCPHPMDPGKEYAPRPLAVAVCRGETAGPDDVCRRSCPENERGFTLTDRYFM